MSGKKTIKRLIVIAGPTASGKTATSIALARHYNTGIISADSRQFYRELKIGTAAPTPEELAAAKHHFIGHLSIYDYYNASQFEQDAIGTIEDIFTRHDVIIMTGGSGLYIDAVCNGIDDLPDPSPELRGELKLLFEQQGIDPLQEMLLKYDPEYYRIVDLNNSKRILRALEVSITAGKPYSLLRNKVPKKRSFEVTTIGLYCERDILNNRIHDRVDLMLKNGLLEEAMEYYPVKHLNALNTVGYKELYAWKDGIVDFAQAIEDIKTNTRRYAKRQMTWFRKNKDIQWVPYDDLNNIYRILNTV